MENVRTFKFTVCDEKAQVTPIFCLTNCSYCDSTAYKSCW